jgi:carbon storage regulator
MLILVRRSGESIKIGDDITIVVLSQKKGQIRLGIDAPEEVTIYREEVLNKIFEHHKVKAEEDRCDA